MTRPLNYLLTFLQVAVLVTSLGSCGRGQSTEPRVLCVVSPDTLDFGSVFLESTRLKDFTVKNEGTTSLELKATALSKPFFMSFLDTTSFTLAPGESRAATIKFGPQAEGLHSRTIRFGDDACPALYCVGEGVIVPVTSCDVYPRSIDFGWVDLGQPRDTSVVLVNTGTETVFGTLGPDCGEYQIQNESRDYALASGDSLIVSVRFTPRTVGEKMCDLGMGSVCRSVSCRGLGIRRRTWLVMQDGSGDATTIQAGIDFSVDGDTVLVGPGRYFESIDLGDKGIELRSLKGPEATILDGSMHGNTIVTIGDFEPQRSSFDGFSITSATGEVAMEIVDASPWIVNNRFVENRAVSILCLDGSPIIQNNDFIDNDCSALTTEFTRGTIFVRAKDPSDSANPLNPSPIIEENRFMGNSARYGGAAIIHHGSAVFRNNVVKDNQVLFDGGGLWIWGRGIIHVRIEANEFSGNSAGHAGGGIASMNLRGRVDISNNLLVGNSTFAGGYDGSWGTGGGIYFVGKSEGNVVNNTLVSNYGTPPCRGDGIAVFEITPESRWTIERNIISDNLNGLISCFSPSGGVLDIRDNLFWLRGEYPSCATECPYDVDANIFADPLFCDAENADYRLAEDSPGLSHPAAPLGAFPSPGCAGSP